jgi:[ribosomal protein S5]-alanine N-acetyltransferase
MLLKINETITISELNPSEDKQHLIYHINDIEVSNNTMTIPHPYGEAEADFFFNLARESKEKYGMPTKFAIRHKGLLIGGIGRGMNYGIDAHKDEIGYYIGRDYRGKGIMSQVVSAFADFLHKEQGLLRIEAGVYLYNPASMRVLENAGFAFEGISVKAQKKGDVYIDVKNYAKVYG